MQVFKGFKPQTRVFNVLYHAISWGKEELVVPIGLDQLRCILNTLSSNNMYLINWELVENWLMTGWDDLGNSNLIS